jgi:multiple sugar transport system permease protein
MRTWDLVKTRGFGSVAMKRLRRGGGLSSSSFLFLMLAPALILLLGLTVVPFITSVGLSLTDYLLTSPPPRFIALKNYADLLSSADFWEALSTSFLFTIGAVALQTVVGVGIAVVLHQETKFAALFRTIYLIPLAITPIAALFTFRMMLNPSRGVMNYLLRQIGVSAQDWLGGHSMALVSLILVDTWQWAPFTLLIVVGGLASLPLEPFEAAKLDGASRWQTFFYITLPLLKPFLSIAFLFRSIDAFKTFDLIYVLTAGGPGTSTTTLNLYGYKQAIEFLSLGYGATIAITIMIIMTIFANICLRKTSMGSIDAIGT